MFKKILYFILLLPFLLPDIGDILFQRSQSLASEKVDQSIVEQNKGRLFDRHKGEMESIETVYLGEDLIDFIPNVSAMVYNTGSTISMGIIGRFI